jgi:serine/threonine protein kinase
MAEGLLHMHELGIAHGDLKLQNVLLFWNIEPVFGEKIDRYD